MNSYSGNNDLRFERLPLWGDSVRLSAIPPIEPAGDAVALPEASETSTTNSAEDGQWDERLSYRRRRDAEDDGRRWRDATTERGSVWERGASSIDASERPRRERVSAYLDESSVVRVTRRSSLRAEQQTDASDDASLGRTRRSTHGFSLVDDDAAQESQREGEKSGINWDYQSDDTFDGDIQAAEAAATARWGHVSSDGAGEASNGGVAEPASTSWGSAFATLRGDVGDSDDTTHEWRESAHDWADDSDETEEPVRISEQVLTADDEVEGSGSDMLTSRRRNSDAEERGGLWAIVDAFCFVPEAVGSFVLGAVGRIRMPGLVVMVVALLVTATLYNPVRDLYLAHRRLDTLQKTYDAVAAQNEQLEREIEVLQTREGIENEARARGYVEPGETKVIVKGLTTEGGNSTYTITDTELPDDRPWYVKVLDYLLGYDPGA